jgi:hypothetical protein
LWASEYIANTLISRTMHHVIHNRFGFPVYLDYAAHNTHPMHTTSLCWSTKYVCIAGSVEPPVVVECGSRVLVYATQHFGNY